VSKIRFYFGMAAMLISVLACAETKSQTTIMNAPSTDVVSEKKTYVEFDFLTHPTKKSEGGFQTYSWRAVYGLKKGLEVGLNGTRTELIDLQPIVELQPNFKWQFYGNEKNGTAATVGGIMFIPTNNRPGIDTFGMLYFNASKKPKAKFAPRITGGFYGLVGRSKGQGERFGVIGAIEQPLFKKVSFVTDYFSGKNRFGYVTPGLVFTPTNKTMFAAGFTIGNQGRGNNAFYFYIGHLF